MENVVHELDEALPALTEIQSYPYSGLEAKLPYMQACIRENFRIAPVAALPLSRRIAPLGGMSVGGHHLPSGVSINTPPQSHSRLTTHSQTLVSVTSTCLHHNAGIFGSDHNDFKPSRWLDENAPDPNLLLHFDNGHRQCMGKNLAAMSIWKLTTTVLKDYTLQLLDPTQSTLYESKGLTERQGPLFVTVKRRL